MIIVSEAKMSRLFAVLRDVLWAQRGDVQTGKLLSYFVSNFLIS